MTARANWHIDVEIPPDDLDDPPVPLIADIATRIDLRDVDELRNRLYQLQSAEVRMSNDGLTCAIRDEPGTSCSSCPLSRPLSSGDDLASLCQNGRMQEQLETSIVIHRLGDPTT